MTITNKHKLSLPLAILFCHSDYDYDPRPNTISATTLLKPTKEIVLGMQNRDLSKEIDIADLIPSVFGSAVHSFGEAGYHDKDTMTKALNALGINEKTQKAIVLNPHPDELEQDQIPFYIERRSERQVDPPVNDWIIRGKFDGCIYGKLTDFKTCSVWKVILDRDNHLDWRIQMSIYRWLNPTIIKSDEASIEVIFTDWSASDSRAKNDYPQLRAMSMDIPLMSLEATREWIHTKVSEIEKFKATKEQADLPPCNDSELWCSAESFKYYKKKGAKRATKIYKNSDDAQSRLASEGTGEVRHFPRTGKKMYLLQRPTNLRPSSRISSIRSSGNLSDK